jgi:hypothetical protein
MLCFDVVLRVVFDHASSETRQRLEAEKIKKQNGHTRSDE